MDILKIKKISRVIVNSIYNNFTKFTIHNKLFRQICCTHGYGHMGRLKIINSVLGTLICGHLLKFRKVKFGTMTLFALNSRQLVQNIQISF